jgi:DNA repair exonuclease SbcCD ATPase subunit
MADFELELELTARIDDLEQGMKEAQRAVEKSSDKMEEATKDASEGGLEPMIAAIGKFAAGLFLAEAAFKIGSASARAFAGDTEAAAAALMSIPILGPIITGMMEFGDSLEYASEEAFKARERLASLREEAKSLDVTVGILGDRISSFAELQRLLGVDEATISEANFDREMERLEATHKAKLMAIDAERMERQKALEEEDIGFEERRRLQKQIDADRTRAIKAAEETLHLQQKITKEKLKQVQKAQVETDLAKEAKFVADRQAELDAQAEEHAAFMLQLGEEQKKKEEERLKIEEQRLALAKKVAAAELEIGKAKAEAASSMSKATASFSTAGGSFTTGVSAELNEAKLLTKVSTASKELLAEIVRNTAGIGAGLV